MKEEKFLLEVKKLNLNYLNQDESIEIPIYFYVDDEGDVIVDFEGMRDEFVDKVNQIKEIAKKR